MIKMNKNKKGQAGFVITVELLLIVTILVIGLVHGLDQVRDNTAAELSDTANAIGALDQSYLYYGSQWVNGAGIVAAVDGAAYNDDTDNTSFSAADTIGGDNVRILYNAKPAAAYNFGSSERAVTF